MKRFLNGVVMALSMFTVIPMPQVWDETAFVWVMPAFPLAGAVIGAIWYGVALLLALLGAPPALYACVLLLAPLLLSGFIHMDGYMDTCDAVFSRAPLEKKRAILKDSHVGAFAVIAFGVYMALGWAALHGALERGADARLFLFIPVLSRCVAGFALLTARPISDTGFGATFRKGTTRIHTLFVAALALLCVVTGYAVCGPRVLYALGSLLLGGALAAMYVIRQLDGISGDLCGFIVTVGELCALLALAAM